MAKNSRLVTIGLRAKTGRAIIVVVGGTRDAPVILYKGEIKLFDPKIPATAQPYHEVMELPWEQSQKAVQESARAIEAIARRDERSRPVENRELPHKGARSGGCLVSASVGSRCRHKQNQAKDFCRSDA